MSKNQVAFWMAGLFSANQRFLKAFETVIYWIKLALKKQHCLWTS